MTVINPSPNRPRQRVSPSPTGKDCSLLHGDIPTSTIRGNGMTFGDRKDQLQYSYAASPQAIENYSSKRQLSSRNQCHRYPSALYKTVAAILILIALASVALNFFMHTAPIFHENANILLGIHASRSLMLKMDGKNFHTNADALRQFNNGDNPSPRIVWLMSFPNRYVINPFAPMYHNSAIRQIL
jgi:hypothetical protein